MTVLEIPQRDQHAALAKAMVQQFEDDKAGWEMWVAEAGPYDLAYAIAQRLVRNLGNAGLVVARQSSGRGRVTSRRFDMRLKENRHPRPGIEGSVT